MKTVSIKKVIERDGLRRLIQDRFRGNMSTCARILNVSTSTISRVLAGLSCIGGKLMTAIIQYCQKRELRLEDYFCYKALC